MGKVTGGNGAKSGRDAVAPLPTNFNSGRISPLLVSPCHRVPSIVLEIEIKVFGDEADDEAAFFEIPFAVYRQN